MMTIGILVVDRKLALPVVGDALGVVNRLITPTVDLPVPPAPGANSYCASVGSVLPCQLQ